MQLHERRARQSPLHLRRFAHSTASAGKLRADVAAQRMAGCGASEEVLAAVFGGLQ